MRIRLFSSLIFIFIFLTVVFNANAKPVSEFSIKSYRSEDVRGFNNLLLNELADNSETWQAQPLSIALKYLNGANFGRFSQITQETPAGESLEYPNKVIVTAIQDGYLDDSLRGEWLELTFKRNEVDMWSIEEAKRAFLCWRGSNTEVFQKEFCP